MLQHLCANQIDVAAGRIVYTQMLNRKGGIESDLTVTRLSETAFLLVVPGATLQRDLNWLRRHVGDAFVVVTDVTAAEAVLCLMGPKARDVLQGLTAADAAVTAFASPRRLAAHVTGVLAQGADKAVQQKLMPVAVGLDAAGNATPAWPAPLHLLAAIVTARGLSWGERWAVTRFMLHLQRLQWRLPVDGSVADLKNDIGANPTFDVDNRGKRGIVLAIKEGLALAPGGTHHDPAAGQPVP